jgi:hypothetical protein
MAETLQLSKLAASTHFHAIYLCDIQGVSSQSLHYGFPFFLFRVDLTFCGLRGKSVPAPLVIVYRLSKAMLRGAVGKGC